MSAYLFDTETTGTGEQDEIIESAIAAASLIGRPHPTEHGPIEVRRYCPERAITFGAMATHHIIEADLQDKPASSSFSLPADVEYLIGHNVDFDWRMAKKPDVKRICTLALSRKLWPGLDSHSQSAIMYFLLEPGEARFAVAGSHDARVDVANLAIVLNAICGELTPTSWKHLWQLSEDARVPVYMPFGKHRPAPGEKGVAIKDLPRDYLEWLVRQQTMDEYVLVAASRALGRTVR